MGLIGGLATASVETPLWSARTAEEINAHLSALVEQFNANPNDLSPIRELISLLENDRENVFVRSGAAGSLGAFGKSHRDRLAPLIVPALARALHRPDGYTRRLAAQSLREFGRASALVLPDLIRELKALDPNTSNYAAETIAEIGPITDQVVPALITVLQQRRANEAVMVAKTWESAARALAHFGPSAKKALPVLHDELRDANGTYCADVAKAIRMIDPTDEHALDALIQVAMDQNKGQYERRYAIYALKSLSANAASALPSLRALLNDGEEPLANSLRIAIATIEAAVGRDESEQNEKGGG